MPVAHSLARPVRNREAPDPRGHLRSLHIGSMRPAKPGDDMNASSTQGIKTVLHPVTDLAAAKAVYTALLGIEPQADAPYYVGYEVEGQQIGLVPGGGPQGMTSPVAYWHVRGHRGEAGRGDRRGRRREGVAARRRRRPPRGHVHRPGRQRPRPGPGPRIATERRPAMEHQRPRTRGHDGQRSREGLDGRGARRDAGERPGAKGAAKRSPEEERAEGERTCRRRSPRCRRRIA